MRRMASSASWKRSRLFKTTMSNGVVVPPVGQFVNHRGVAMEGEDHRSVGREQLVEILVLQAMGMLRLRLKHHQIDHVDDADPDIGDVLPQQRYGSHRFQRR